MLVKNVIKRRFNGKELISEAAMPTFDDYISDLSILFESYPTKGNRQLHDVRLAMTLIDALEEVANQLPELPREKGKHD